MHVPAGLMEASLAAAGGCNGDTVADLPLCEGG